MAKEESIKTQSKIYPFTLVHADMGITVTVFPPKGAGAPARQIASKVPALDPKK